MTDSIDSQDKWQRLDWQLLKNGPIVLYFKNEVLNDNVEWFRRNRYDVYSLDCTDWTSIEDFHHAIKKVLGFPDCYGDNMDAFNDCLSDLEIPGNSGAILVFNRFDSFARKFHSAAQTILDIIAVASRWFLLQERRLLALVQSDNSRLSFDPVGACPVDWNPAEWLSKSRGL